MATSFIKLVVLYGNKFYMSTSFMKPEVLCGSKFLYKVLIGNRFYIATRKQVFFYEATSFTSDGKCSIFENKFYLW